MFNKLLALAPCGIRLSNRMIDNDILSRYFKCLRMKNMRMVFTLYHNYFFFSICCCIIVLSRTGKKDKEQEGKRVRNE